MRGDLALRLSLQIGERIRDYATRQGNIPFDKGDLRKSVVVRVHGRIVVVGSNLPYARAAHDGRPRIVIKPKRAKSLKFKGRRGKAVFAKQVVQPARKGKPYLRNAVDQVEREGLAFLLPMLTQEVGNDLAAAFVKAGFKVQRL